MSGHHQRLDAGWGGASSSGAAAPKQHGGWKASVAPPAPAGGGGQTPAVAMGDWGAVASASSAGQQSSSSGGWGACTSAPPGSSGVVASGQQSGWGGAPMVPPSPADESGQMSSASTRTIDREIKRQMEFYFGDSNLCDDENLLELTEDEEGAHQGWVDLAQPCSWPNMQQLLTGLDGGGCAADQVQPQHLARVAQVLDNYSGLLATRQGGSGGDPLFQVRREAPLPPPAVLNGTNYAPSSAAQILVKTRPRLQRAQLKLQEGRRIAALASVMESREAQGTGYHAHFEGRVDHTRDDEAEVTEVSIFESQEQCLDDEAEPIGTLETSLSPDTVHGMVCPMREDGDVSKARPMLIQCVRDTALTLLKLSIFACRDARGGAWKTKRVKDPDLEAEPAPTFIPGLKEICLSAAVTGPSNTELKKKNLMWDTAVITELDAEFELARLDAALRQAALKDTQIAIMSPEERLKTLREAADKESKIVDNYRGDNQRRRPRSIVSFYKGDKETHATSPFTRVTQLCQTKLGVLGEKELRHSDVQDTHKYVAVVARFVLCRVEMEQLRVDQTKAELAKLRKLLSGLPPLSSLAPHLDVPQCRSVHVVEDTRVKAALPRRPHEAGHAKEAAAKSDGQEEVSLIDSIRRLLVVAATTASEENDSWMRPGGKSCPLTQLPKSVQEGIFAQLRSGVHIKPSRPLSEAPCMALTVQLTPRSDVRRSVQEQPRHHVQQERRIEWSWRNVQFAMIDITAWLDVGVQSQHACPVTLTGEERNRVRVRVEAMQLSAKSSGKKGPLRRLVVTKPEEWTMPLEQESSGPDVAQGVYRSCSCCGDRLPLVSFSKTQRHGDLKCPNCTGANMAPQLQVRTSSHCVPLKRSVWLLRYSSRHALMCRRRCWQSDRKEH